MEERTKARRDRERAERERERASASACIRLFVLQLRPTKTNRRPKESTRKNRTSEGERENERSIARLATSEGVGFRRSMVMRMTDGATTILSCMLHGSCVSPVCTRLYPGRARVRELYMCIPTQYCGEINVWTQSSRLSNEMR